MSNLIFFHSELQEEYLNTQPEANEYYTSKATKEDLASASLKDWKWVSPIDTNIAESQIATKKNKLQNLVDNFDLGSVREYVIETTNITSNKKLALNDLYYTKMDFELNATIVRCVKHHMFIMDTCWKFKKLYSPIILIKALQISSFLGIAAYGGSVSDFF